MRMSVTGRRTQLSTAGGILSVAQVNKVTNKHTKRHTNGIEACGRGQTVSDSQQRMILWHNICPGQETRGDKLAAIASENSNLDTNWALGGGVRSVRGTLAVWQLKLVRFGC